MHINLFKNYCFILFLSLFVISCSSDKNKANSTDSTIKKESLFGENKETIEEYTNSNFSLSTSDCGVDSDGYLVAKSWTGSIHSFHKIFNNYKHVLILEATMLGGQIRLNIQFGDYLDSSYSSIQYRTISKEVVLVGRYEFDNPNGIANVLIDNLKVAELTYGGTYNDSPLLDVSFNKNIFNQIPNIDIELKRSLVDEVILFEGTGKGKILSGYSPDANLLCNDKKSEIFKK